VKLIEFKSIQTVGYIGLEASIQTVGYIRLELTQKTIHRVVRRGGTIFFFLSRKSEPFVADPIVIREQGVPRQPPILALPRRVRRGWW